MSFRHSVSEIPLPSSPKFRNYRLDVVQNSYHPLVPCGKSNLRSSEEKDESTRRENLDTRLNKLMLGEDLPLFLQEFADEWQKQKIRRKTAEEDKSCSTNEICSREDSNFKEDSRSQEEVYLRDKIEKITDNSTSSRNQPKCLKKCVKRLGDITSFTIKIKDKVKKLVANELRIKLRQDIMNHMIDIQLDKWYSQHVIDIS